MGVRCYRVISKSAGMLLAHFNRSQDDGNLERVALKGDDYHFHLAVPPASNGAELTFLLVRWLVQPGDLGPDRAQWGREEPINLEPWEGSSNVYPSGCFSRLS